MGQARITVLGSMIDTLTMEESLTRVEYFIENKIPVQHVVVNAGKIVMMQENKKLSEIVNSCAMINADGQAVVWAARFLGYNLPERVAGIDLMMEILKMANIKGYRIFLLGATEEIIEATTKKILNLFPNIKIAGYRNGYWSEQEESHVIKMIADSKADILFVGISSPKKEFWLAENIEKLNVPFCMGVGGSFDVIAGKTKRAPVWMQKAGLEWFYRFIQEPRRMWKRYLIGNSKFIWLVLKEKFLQLTKIGGPS